MGFAAFFGEEKRFLIDRIIEQIWKSSLGGATIGARMSDKIFKIWENGCKVCDNHFGHLETNWITERKILPRYFTSCIVDVHPYKNISLAHYRVPRKTVKFVPVVQKKRMVGPTFVCTESLLSRAI